MDKAKYKCLDENSKINSYGKIEFINKKVSYIKITYKKFENKNDKVYLTWKTSRWNPYERIEVYAKKDGEKDYKFLDYKESYLEKMKIDRKYSNGYDLLIKFIGENEKLIQSKKIRMVLDVI